MTVKSNQLEQELARANKTIQKSKKAVEVQQLLKENQSLNQKLATQDEDFRLQNQTLLQELSKVRLNHQTLMKKPASPTNIFFSQLVEQNERLEKRVKQQDGCDDVSPDDQAGLTEKELVQLLETERKTSTRLAAENAQFRDRLKQPQQPSRAKRQSESRQETVDIGVSSDKLGALGAVSFKKQNVSVEGRTVQSHYIY